MRPGKKKRKEFERLQRDIERQAERFGQDQDAPARVENQYLHFEYADLPGHDRENRPGGE